MASSAARTLRLAALVALAAVSVWCSVNRWGNRCVEDADCDDTDLVCAKAAPDNITGYCRYAGELRCAAGTVLQLEGGEPRCVRDGPVELTCGPGTVESGGQCVLAVDAGPDAEVPVDGGVDAAAPDAAPELDAAVDAGVDAAPADGL